MRHGVNGDASVPSARGATGHSAIAQDGLPLGPLSTTCHCCCVGMQGRPEPRPTQQCANARQHKVTSIPRVLLTSIHRGSKALPCPWRGRRAATTSNAQCTGPTSSVYTQPARTGWWNGALHMLALGRAPSNDRAPQQHNMPPPKNLARAAALACTSHGCPNTCGRPLPVNNGPGPMHDRLHLPGPTPNID
jgi:hypothetical protein